MTEDAKPTHAGYANGSSVLDQATFENAVARLLSETWTETKKNADGSVLVRTFHETDPPEDFQEIRSMKRPGPLPALVPFSGLAKGARVEEHEHEAIMDPAEDMDVRLYHLARWAVLEARRIRAKTLAVRSVGRGDAPGSVLLRLVFAK